MKKTIHDFKPGTRVSEKIHLPFYEEMQPPLKGVVLEKKATTLKNAVVVKWDAAWHSKPLEVSVKDLMLESEAAEQFLKLEKEFEALATEVKFKMDAAAKLVLEANDLAKKHGQSSLNDMLNSIEPLFSALDDCGWNTSSMGC